LSRGLNAVPYCPDRRLPGDSRTAAGPSAPSGQPLVLQGTPVQELFLGFQVGLKAVPKGPLVLWKWQRFPCSCLGLHEGPKVSMGSGLGSLRVGPEALDLTSAHVAPCRLGWWSNLQVERCQDSP